jgi:hypothetical protein
MRSKLQRQHIDLRQAWVVNTTSDPANEFYNYVRLFAHLGVGTGRPTKLVYGDLQWRVIVHADAYL